MAPLKSPSAITSPPKYLSHEALVAAHPLAKSPLRVPSIVARPKPI